MPTYPDDSGAWMASVDQRLRELFTLAASAAGPARTLVTTLTIASPVASVSCEIPSGYRHLAIDIPYAAASTDGFLYARFNGDSGTNYASLVEYVFANPGTEGLGGAWADPFVILAPIGATHATSQARVLEYTDTALWKSYVSSGMHASATDTAHGMSSSVGVWKATAAITELTIGVTAGDLTAGRILIYGER